MLVVYLIPILMMFGIIRGMILEIRKKRWFTALCGLLIIPWIVYAVVSIVIGGSTFNDAATEYEAYEAGHYYLQYHSTYTEVPYAVFTKMRVFEILAWISYAVSFFSSIIINLFRVEQSIIHYHPSLKEKKQYSFFNDNEQ